MTGYELRRHLAAMHRVVMWGASCALLKARHDEAHLTGLAEHTHDHDGEGDG